MFKDDTRRRRRSRRERKGGSKVTPVDVTHETSESKLSSALVSCKLDDDESGEVKKCKLQSYAERGKEGARGGDDNETLSRMLR